MLENVRKAGVVDAVDDGCGNTGVKLSFNVASFLKSVSLKIPSLNMFPVSMMVDVAPNAAPLPLGVKIFTFLTSTAFPMVVVDV